MENCGTNGQGRLSCVTRLRQRDLIPALAAGGPLWSAAGCSLRPLPLSPRAGPKAQEDGRVLVCVAFFEQRRYKKKRGWVLLVAARTCSYVAARTRRVAASARAAQQTESSHHFPAVAAVTTALGADEDKKKRSSAHCLSGKLCAGGGSDSEAEAAAAGRPGSGGRRMLALPSWALPGSTLALPTEGAGALGSSHCGTVIEQTAQRL